MKKARRSGPVSRENLARLERAVVPAMIAAAEVLAGIDVVRAIPRGAGCVMVRCGGTDDDVAAVGMVEGVAVVDHSGGAQAGPESANHNGGHKRADEHGVSP